MGFAAALSRHPVTAHALGEVIGQVHEAVGPGPDLAVVLLSRGHAGTLEDVGAALRRLLVPTVVLGAVADTVCGPGPDLEPGAGVALWAGHTGPTSPLLHVGGDTADLSVPTGGPTAALLLSDTAGRLGRVASAVAAPGSGATAVGGTTGLGGLLVQDRVVHNATVGAAFAAAVGLAVVASDGLRAIGDLLTVTRAEGPMAYELDGRPAYSRLLDMVADRIPATDLRLVNAGLHLAVMGPGGDGVAHGGDADHRPAVPTAGTTAVRGRDPATGALVLTGDVEPGSRVRFAVRDPATTAGALRAARPRPGSCSAAALVLRADPAPRSGAELPGGGGGGGGGDHLELPVAGCATVEHAWVRAGPRASTSGSGLPAGAAWEGGGLAVVFDDGEVGRGLDPEGRWVR